MLLWYLSMNVRAEEAASASAGAATVDFVRDIQPIFESACYKCHDGAKHKGGLRLDSKATAFIGGDSGDASIIPGDPGHSKLLQLVRGDDPKSVMPPKGQKLILHTDRLAGQVDQAGRCLAQWD